MTKARKIAIIISSTLLAICGILSFFLWRAQPEPYLKLKSPDGNFILSIEKPPSFWPSATMPGQASDSVVTAKLINSTGEVVDKKEIEMLQLIEEIKWGSDRVTITPQVELFYSKSKRKDAGINSH